MGDNLAESPIGRDCFVLFGLLTQSFCFRISPHFESWSTNSEQLPNVDNQDDTPRAPVLISCLDIECCKTMVPVYLSVRGDTGQHLSFHIGFLLLDELPLSVLSLMHVGFP